MRQALQSNRFIPRLGRTEVQATVYTAIAEEAKHQNIVLSRSEHSRLFETIVAEPAAPLAIPYWLATLVEKSNEIFIVGPYQVFSRKQDELLSTKSQFEDETHLLYILNLLLENTDERLNKNTPAVYVHLSNQEVIMAMMPPATEVIVASLRINSDQPE